MCVCVCVCVGCGDENCENGLSIICRVVVVVVLLICAQCSVSNVR